MVRAILQEASLIVYDGGHNSCVFWKLVSGRLVGKEQEAEKKLWTRKRRKHRIRADKDSQNP
jgi:hypothetical protein